MRRILITAFAAIASWGVMANNFVPVSAPTIAGEISDLESQHGSFGNERSYIPIGMAQLSGLRIALPARAEVAVESPSVTSLPSLPAHDLSIEPWRTRPSSRIETQRLFSLPVVPLSANLLARSADDHFLNRDLSVPTFFERIASGPDAAPPGIEAVFEPISTWAASPDTRIAAKALFPMPKMISPSVLGLSRDEHFIGGSGSFGRDAVSTTPSGAIAEIRKTTSNDRPFFVAASYELPSADIRSIKLLPAPEQLPSTAILAGYFGDHSGSPGLEKPALPAVEVPAAPASAVPSKGIAAQIIQALYEAPSAIFEHARKLAAPQEEIPASILSAGTEDHPEANTYAVLSERRKVTTDADAAFLAAPKLPEFIAASYQVAGEAVSSEQLFQVPDIPVSPARLSVFEGMHRQLGVRSQDLRSGRTGETASTSDPETFAAYSISSENPAFDEHRLTYGSRPDIRPQIAASAKTVDQTPVLVSASTEMYTALLSPLDKRPAELMPASAEADSAVAMNHSAFYRGTDDTQFNRMLESPAAPMFSARPAPVLISARPEFSSELLKPMSGSTSTERAFYNFDSKEEIIAAVKQDGNYCDPNWVGPPIRFSQTVELKLDDLIRQLHQRFGVNFIVGKGVADLPMNIKAGSIPWNVLLRSQLFISGVRARCIDTNTIELIENKDLPGLQDMADVETRFVKLKFLQRTGSGTVDLANRSQGGQNGNQGGGCGGNNQGGTSGSIQTGGGGQSGGQQGQTAGQLSNNKFDKLIIEIEKILGLRSMTESSVGSGGQGGGSGGQGSAGQQTEVIRTNRFVTQIPGRNILAIRATKEEHELIDQIISRADRPPFQVVIKGLVYTANQDRLRDIGVQTTITGGTADNRSNGGIFGDTLGTGTLFDFSTIIGTFDFNVQATAFQQNGVISVKSRPFATVIDGLCTTLDVGRQLPIVIDSTLGGQGDVVFVNAANNLAVTPYVIDDDKGDPMAVTLELRLTANDIDSSVTARGVPAISARSIQTQLLLGEDKTAILGGFTVDSDSRTVRKTPGLGDIPIIGELFKRRIRDTRVNRLYFAISVSVIPFPDAIRPVDVPGATTDPPSITPEMKTRSNKAEPKQVKGP